MGFLTRAKGIRGFLFKVRQKKRKIKNIKSSWKRKAVKIRGKPSFTCQICGKPEIGALSGTFFYAKHPVRKRSKVTGIICSECCNGRFVYETAQDQIPKKESIIQPGFPPKKGTKTKKA